MQRGSTLVEILVYIFILLLVVGGVTNSMFSINRSYEKIQSVSAVEVSAETALDRIIREVRTSNSIDVANSTFTTSPGVLTLNTKDSTGTAATVAFFLNNGSIHIKENSVDMGPLTSDKVRVTSLIFRSIITATSSAVKIDLTAESGSGQNYKSANFYGTAVLRGSYQP